MKRKPIEMQCIPARQYTAAQKVCAAAVNVLYALSGAALALGIVPPLLTTALPVWQGVLSAGLCAVSCALLQLGCWTERNAL